jgi:chloramphenicol-sensitive protein RarD
VVAVEALPGLAAETTLAAPLALAWLAWQAHAGSGWFGGGDAFLQGWLVASGIVTAVPLSLFAFGARRIPYSTVGIIQYIGPTLQLTAGILAFREPFPAVRAIGFAFIWAALALYAGEGLLRTRRMRALPADRI